MISENLRIFWHRLKCKHDYRYVCTIKTNTGLDKKTAFKCAKCGKVILK